MNTCVLCGRNPIETTEHHLVPRTLHANKKIRKLYSVDQLLETIDVCRSCHDIIHAVLEEKEMALSYNTKELLIKYDKIANFCKWISKKPVTFETNSKMSNNRKEGK